MKFALTPLMLCCLIGGQGDAWGQSSTDHQFDPPVYNSILHINSDSGKLKGRMIEMTDSTVSIMLLKAPGRMDIDVRLINSIRVKKRFFRSVFMDFVLGVTLTTVLVSAYYWKEGFWDPDMPSYGQALLGGLAIGGGGGILFGMAESTFFKVRIPVNKSLELFRLNRRKLLKYWLGNE